MVIEGAVHEHESDGNSRRDANRARHRDEERRVLVAVADLGAQHVARRRQADSRFLVEQPVDVARQTLRPIAIADGSTHGPFGFRPYQGIVAFDERLWGEIGFGPGIGGTRLQDSRIDELDHVAIEPLSYTINVGERQLHTFESKPQPTHIARFVNALSGNGYDGGRLQQIRLNPTGNGKALRTLGGLAHGDQSERALFSDDLARVCDPRGRVQTAKIHVDTERRNYGVVGTHHVSISHANADLCTLQGRRVEHGPFVVSAGHESPVREQTGQVLRDHRRLG